MIGLAAIFHSPVSIHAQEPEKLVIGHSNLRNDIAALWVPKELGIFRKYGVEATIVLITGGARMTQALLSGSAPMAFTGATPVVTAVGGGADSVLILGINNKLTYDIWAKAEIKKPEELKGKTIGISGFGSSSHVASFLMLQHFNLDEKRDRITFVAIGDEPTRAQAVLAGRIDATLMDASISGQIKGKGPTYLGNLEQLGVPFVNNALVTTRVVSQGATENRRSGGQSDRRRQCFHPQSRPIARRSQISSPDTCGFPPKMPSRPTTT